VSHLIGHEGPGSLLSELKNRGWVNSLVAGESSGAKGFSFFGINVDLTEDGIQHTDDIVTLVFQVIVTLVFQVPFSFLFFLSLLFHSFDREGKIRVECVVLDST